VAYLKLLRTLLFGVPALVFWTAAAVAADHYGAIAYSTDNGRYGYTYDYGTLASAQADALKNCNDGSCQVVLWFKNSCGALAIGNRYSYGAAWANNRGDAETSAMTFCSQNGTGCNIAQWLCTSQ
jgi:Domain of unknown function (DUF4189)